MRISPLLLVVVLLPFITASLDDVKKDIKSGKRPIKGVNLGGWLVAEHWMTKNSPAWRGVDDLIASKGEYATMKALGHRRGDTKFEDHRRTFITEQDFRDIAAAGLNTVRIPVGYWIVGFDNSGGGDPDGWRVWAPGALDYLDKAIQEWGPRNNILVVISFHAAKGSQNGNHHSSPQHHGRGYWSQYKENVNNTLDAVTFLANRYKDNTSFLGIGLLNAPENQDEGVLKQYYYDAYGRIRNDVGSDCLLMTSPMLSQQGPGQSDWDRFMPPPNFTNVRHEWKKYQVWGFSAHEGWNGDKIISHVENELRRDFNKWDGNWLFVGEWSMATEGSVQMNDDQWKRYAKAQLETFGKAVGGWTFWTWKFFGDDGGHRNGWTLKSMINKEIIPRQHSQNPDKNEKKKIKFSDINYQSSRHIKIDRSRIILGTSSAPSKTISLSFREILAYIIVSGLLIALLFIAIFAAYRLFKKALRQRVLRKQFIELTELDVNGLDRDSIKGLLRHYFPSKTYIKWKTLSVGLSCGKGNFGAVSKGCVLRSNGEPKSEVAIKRLNSENINLNALKEANLMRDLSVFKHEHILELCGVAVTDTCKICIITEFMPNGSLHSYMNQHLCSPNHKLRFCKEIASGLYFIHQNKVLHLDLAARNCMVDHKKHIRISDFGQSRKFSQYLRAVQLNDAVVAFRWMPIEFFDNQPITTAGDIWSFGVTAWEIFTECREDPYGKNLVCYKFLKDGNRLLLPKYGTTSDVSVFAMIARCWSESQNLRPAAEELLGFFKPLVEDESTLNSNGNPDSNDASSPLMDSVKPLATVESNVIIDIQPESSNNYTPSPSVLHR